MSPTKLAPLLLALCLLSCRRPAAINAAEHEFDKVNLGMPLEDATQFIGRHGTPCDHDKLPSPLLPRQAFKGLPNSTKWFVWSDPATGLPSLTLGIFETHVIYKETQWDDKGQRKTARWTLPEYQ